MQNPPPVQMTQMPKSSTGLDENVAAVLSYVFNWVSGLVFFLIEKESRLVRFHAMQSLILAVVFFVGMIALYIVWAILAIITSQISGLLATLVGLVVGLLIFVFFIAAVIGWILGMVKAYQGQFFKLPVIGNFAEKFSTK
ncbi:MAG TPA: hypothetical protein VFB65_09570 [Pyrinomonadaceae bacterium]|nr:hypothetical protein [Pyrinomonadaceae bacterium]